jgi:hypothetical protein
MGSPPALDRRVDEASRQYASDGCHRVDRVAPFIAVVGRRGPFTAEIAALPAAANKCVKDT